MDSPLLAAPGAVPATGLDAGVAAHYGDPYAEQRALDTSAGVVDRSHLGVIRITGQDRLSWLHSLSTQHLEQLTPGSAAETLILSPQGRVEHHLTLTDDGTALWAHVTPGTQEALLAFLTSMRFMLRVDPQDVTGEFAVLTLQMLEHNPAVFEPAPVKLTRETISCVMAATQKNVTSDVALRELYRELQARPAA